MVIKQKKIVNSNGLLTGFLNLTIESAPTIPNERAIFPDINFVTTNVIGGNNKQVKVKWKVLAHLCLAIVSDNLIKKPMNEDNNTCTAVKIIFRNNICFYLLLIIFIF